MKLAINLKMFAAAMGVVFVSSGAALAQTFPTKPLKLIVPFPAGGPADLFARELSQGMAVDLKQPVLVENKGGVGGTLGVDLAAKAPPDGYTLALNSGSALVIQPYARKKMLYDADKDLALLTLVVKVPEVLVVHPSVPANNLRELVAYYKANPGKKNYGSTGSGSITHLAAELLKAEAGVDVVHVPYAGAAPALTSLLGGHVEMVVLDVPVLMAQIKAGKVKAIAVTSATRASAIPDVPTMTEAGYPKVNSDNWYGLVGAVAIPQPIQQRIRAAAVKTLNSPEVAKQFASISAVPIPSTSEEYRKVVVAEQAKWSSIIKAIGFQPEE